MRKGRKGVLLVALAGLFVFGFGTSALGAAHDLPGMSSADSATGGGIEAAAIGELGDTTVTPPLTDVLDLPALHIQEDAEGRIVMDLPALTLVGPPQPAAVQPPAVTPPAAPPTVPDPAADRRPELPVTGVGVGELLALGMAALSGGGVLARRLRLGLGS